MENSLILIVDDDKEIRDLIEIYLKNDGYEVLKAGDGTEALEIIQREKIDLVILDIMMPKLDGIKACLKIREEENMPIIMLSAKSQDMDKINGLTTGADDYITKPFNPLELVARVKSQLRRYKILNSINDNSSKDEIKVKDLIINTITHQVMVSGREVSLTPTEFSILELLVKNKGVVFSSEKIYSAVWNEPFYESENTVMVHIRKLREKIEENPKKPSFIKTIWGVGYKIEK